MNITPYFSGKIAKRIENPINGIILTKTAKAVDEIAIRFSIATQKMVMGTIIIRNAFNLLLEIE